MIDTDQDRLVVLIRESDICERVAELGAEIARAYGGEPLTVVGILKGSVFFLADLVRRLPMPVRLEFLRASSYGVGTASSGAVALRGEAPLDDAIADRHVLVVDDILDSGRTLSAIVDRLSRMGPRSIRTCVLAAKRCPRAIPFDADFRAFEIPDVFIVGYGLDHAELFRNLPHVAVLTSGGAAGSGPVAR